MSAALWGKILITRLRGWISLLTRSRGSVDQILGQCAGERGEEHLGLRVVHEGALVCANFVRNPAAT